MISAVSFKTSRWAFQPWLRPSINHVTTFRVFVQLIEKTCEKPSQASTADVYTHRTPQ